MHTLRTLIFARHLFSHVHIFAAYVFAPEALGINFRYVSIFARWLFSLFFLRKSIRSNFRVFLHAYKYSHKFDMLASVFAFFSWLKLMSFWLWLEWIVRICQTYGIVKWPKNSKKQFVNQFESMGDRHHYCIKSIFPEVAMVSAPSVHL